MDAAWELGINHFDTADAYGGGRSETTIGRWIASRGQRPLLTTKTYNPMVAGGDHGLAPKRIGPPVALEPAAARRRPRRALPHPRVRPRGGAGARARGTRAASATRAWSVPSASATTTTAQLRATLAAGHVDAIQNSYSLLVREDERELLELCAAEQRELQRLQPARRRLADGQVPPRREVPGGLADDPAPGGIRGVPRAIACSTRSSASSALARRATASRWRRSHWDGCSRTRSSRRSSSGRGGRSISSRCAKRSPTRSRRMSATPSREAVCVSVLILSEAEVTEHLPMDECIDAMERCSARARAARRRCRCARCCAARVRQGSSGLMPAYRGGEHPVYSLKAVCVFPDNPRVGLDAHQGVVTLFDGETGRPTAILDASALTAIRTAAVTALATRLLAREDATRLAIIGSGVQAQAHVRSLLLARATSLGRGLLAQRRARPRLRGGRGPRARRDELRARRQRARGTRWCRRRADRDQLGARR